MQDSKLGQPMGHTRKFGEYAIPGAYDGMEFDPS